MQKLADETGLAFLLQSLQRLDGPFRPGMVGGIDSVVVEDVDMIHLQALEAGLKALDKTPLRIDRILHASADSLLGRNDNLVADAHFLDNASDHLFIAAVLVDRGGVEVANA